MLRIPMQLNIDISLKRHQNIGLENCENPKNLIEYSNNMEDIYEETLKNKILNNLNNERKILSVFDNMIADMLKIKKKLEEIVTE